MKICRRTKVKQNIIKIRNQSRKSRKQSFNCFLLFFIFGGIDPFFKKIFKFFWLFCAVFTVIMPILGHFLKFETNTSVFPRTSRSGFTAKRERSAIVTARYDREALDTFKTEIVKHFMQPAEGIRRVRKLLTDKAQAVVYNPIRVFFYAQTACKITLRENPYEGKIGYES